MKLDIAQAKIFAVLLNHFLAGHRPPMSGLARALGIPAEDLDFDIHWPRFCAYKALQAMRAIESEIANTPADERGS